ncbi:MAG: phage tail protein [Bacteroidia bacterium]|nr:phage tail protein [Bacteroidia bacterium]
MATYYPPVGFHFVVRFELGKQSDLDIQFQEVSGLAVDLEMESYVEGGENRFTHQLPTRTKYADLSLKRGLVTDSGLVKWCKDAIENFSFKPLNLTVSLLNKSHTPLASWQVVGAIPKRWDVSSFNAEQNSVAIETLQLSYHYFLRT